MSQWSRGDWMCAACQHRNFRRRDTCQLCGYSKFGGLMDPHTCTRTEVLAGDWYCTAINCGAHNYASRSICYRCGYPKIGEPGVSSYPYNRTEVLPGDWYCTAMNCGAHNYASRSSCYRCGALKNNVINSQNFT